MTTAETINWKEVFVDAKKRRMSVRVQYGDVTPEIHEIAVNNGFAHIEELNMVKFFIPKP